MSKLTKRAFRILKNSKGQNVAIALVMAIGIMIYMAMSTAMLNLETTVNDYYELTNLADVYVDVVKIPKSSVNKLLEMNGVEAVAGRLSLDVPLKVEDEDEKVTVRLISVPSSETKVSNLYINSGSRITEKDKENYVIQNFSNARAIEIGDILRPQILGTEYQLKVKAIVSSPEFIYLMENEQSLMPNPTKFGILFVAEELLMKSLGMEGNYNQVVIKAKAGTDLDKLKNKVEDELDKFGVRRIYTRENQLSVRIVNEEIKQNKNTSSTIPLLFLAVAAIIQTVMVSRMVKNDRVAIGILKSMGYTNRQIISHYSIYTVFIGICGSLVGVIAGYLLSTLFTQMYATMFFNIPILTVKFYPMYFVLAILMSVSFSFTSGLWGAKDVVKILPALSMRPEPPKIGKSMILEKTRLWKHFSFSEKMVFRNMFRSKKRLIVIAAGIALTYAIILVPIYMYDEFVNMFTYQFSEFQAMDYNVNFNGLFNEKIVYDIENELEIDNVEGKIDFPFEVHNKWISKTINIIGLEKNTRYYNFVDKSSGKEVVLKKGDLFINGGMANVMNIEKGDYIKIKTFLPGKDDQILRVTGIINQNLGANIYMDLEDMQSKFLEKNAINGVFIDTKLDLKSEMKEYKNISSVQSVADISRIFKEFLALTNVSISILVIFGGILGVAIVYNATVMSINERTLEFSSLRVMGLSKREIFMTVLKENILISIIGIIIGIPMGISFIRAIADSFSNDLYSFSSNITMQSITTTALLTILFIIISQILTYNKIHKLDFIDALKNRIT